jgi:hypothetical protein
MATRRDSLPHFMLRRNIDHAASRSDAPQRGVHSGCNEWRWRRASADTSPDLR